MMKCKIFALMMVLSLNVVASFSHHARTVGEPELPKRYWDTLPAFVGSEKTKATTACDFKSPEECTLWCGKCCLHDKTLICCDY